MRITPLVVITLAFAIYAQAQTRADRTHRADLYRPPAMCALKHRHECEARQQQIRDPVSGIRINAGDAARFSHAQLWLLSAEQKENQTFSIVHADNRKSLDDTGVGILKELSGNRFLIETERYDGFKTTRLKLLDGNVTFH
jgi:hypothetical protein